jgi:septal ring factor EnvC (AmiA/AmiB activator)
VAALNRDDLVERKEAVRAEIAQTRRELARARQAETAALERDRRKHVRRIEELEARLVVLMAEEHSLRLKIDRTG